MSLRQCVMVLFSLVMTSVVSACAITTAGSPHKECPTTFDPSKSPEPLGSSDRFHELAFKASTTPGYTTTLGRLTADAGWNNAGWDRVIQESDGMTDEYLNEVAQTPGMCWATGEAPDPFNHELGSGYYIFLHGPTPVQAVPWSPGGELLRIVGEHGATQNTRFEATPADNPDMLMEISDEATTGAPN